MNFTISNVVKLLSSCDLLLPETYDFMLYSNLCLHVYFLDRSMTFIKLQVSLLMFSKSLFVDMYYLITKQWVFSKRKIWHGNFTKGLG